MINQGKFGLIQLPEFIWSVNEKNKHTTREIDQDQVRIEFPIDFDPEVHLLKEFMQMVGDFFLYVLKIAKKKVVLDQKNVGLEINGPDGVPVQVKERFH